MKTTSYQDKDNMTQPFKVRASCGHIVIRRMREATAGVPYTEDTILDAPNGRACNDCEATPRNATPQKAKVHLTLSGGNGETVRSVYADGEEIGTVRQHMVSKSWFSLGMRGEQHGFYTTDWTAAKQLALAQGMTPDA